MLKKILVILLINKPTQMKNYAECEQLDVNVFYTFFTHLSM